LFHVLVFSKILLAESPGLIDKWAYIKTWRLIYILFPDFVPDEILKAIEPKKGEEFDRDVYMLWHCLPKRSIEKKRDLVLHIHGHIDGVQWFKDSNQGKGVPILGRLVAVEDKVSKEIIKIPNLSPFVIGVMQVCFFDLFTLFTLPSKCYYLGGKFKTIYPFTRCLVNGII
jgi:hypothetical protein